MTISKKIIPCIYSLAGTLAAALAFAEEGGHGDHAEEAYTFLGDWLPRLINFGILAAILVYFGRKPIRDFFKARTAEIAKSMQESKEARKRATSALEEMERKVKEVEAETGRMIADAQARAEQDKQALIAEGKKVVADIQEQVKASAEVELQKARTSLSVEAALLSIDLAEGKIKERMSAQDHERILKEYIKKVGGRG